MSAQGYWNGRIGQWLAGWRMGVLLLVLLVTAQAGARAQQVLVQANVADDTVKNSFGPNRHYFGHLYVGYGLLAGASAPGAGLRYGFNSGELRGGGRLKVRFTQALAATIDLGYGYLRYELDQNAQKAVPDNVQHRRETLALHRLYSEVGLRLNYGRRGNAVGSYLDLLASGGWAAGSSHTTEDDPAPGVGSVETIEHGLPYMRRWSTGLGARLGFDRYALTARYRTSAAFTNAYTAWPELPRWLLGLEIGLF